MKFTAIEADVRQNVLGICAIFEELTRPFDVANSPRKEILDSFGGVKELTKAIQIMDAASE